ncbi:non-ribosomal peptide synthetase [Amycolatopsis antarctica]|nr:non-ribosomal peptide synthetase [Amycolatopsis antarctica]
MSSGQRGLWFLNEFDQGGAEYNVAVGLRLSGALDRHSLLTALSHLIRRHESLRTTFGSVDGRGVMLVGDSAGPELNEIDLTAMPRSGQQAELSRLLTEEAGQSFDLSRGPLFRATLIGLEPTRHVLVLSMHHIVSDGWSLGLLARDLGALYRAACEGRGTAELPRLPVRWADFAAWQNERWNRGELAGQLEYWRDRLEGIEPLELPVDRPRPAVRSSAGAVHWFSVPEPTTRALIALGREHGATLFMTLIATTHVLLSRYCRQDDVTVGTVTSGRPRTELEHLVGLFVNTIPIRSTMHEGLTFAEHLANVRRTVLDGFANAEIPFERLVEELAPVRDTSTTPLVQALVTLQNAPAMEFDLPGLEVEPFSLPRTNATRDVSIEFTEQGGKLEASLEYSTDLFDAATAERLAAGLVVLLGAVAADPSENVGRLPVHSPADEELIESWNKTAMDSGEPRCLHEIFAEQARRTPDSPAVEFNGKAWTFGYLDARANQVANRLADLGVVPDTLIGLCLERGPELLAGILGIMKSGGAYVPLDPSYPVDRIEFMIEDSGSTMVVTQSDLHGLFDGSDIELVDIDSVGSCDRATGPTGGARPDSLAYVIYTSGSTGEPKGVQVEHRNLHYIAHAWNERYQLCSAKLRFVSVSSISVDLFLADFIRSALFGGVLIIAPADVVTEPSSLVDLVAGASATGLEMSPSLAASVVTEARRRKSGLETLRLVSVGSEGWRVEDCRDLLDVVSREAMVINAYGGTEATVDSSVHQVTPESLNGRGFVPIGRPLANTRIELRNGIGNAVPIGVAGELYIGGDGVARGYHGRAELTAKRFQRDDSGRRFYRTGDLARWLPTGELEFLGRADDQVKIRGFRIELGEVEGALIAIPAIAEVAVTARRDGAVQRLVAYLVPVAGTAVPSVAELRASLGRTLPDYMIPSIFVPLDRLPMTPSGKVDRKALPKPDGRPELAQAYTAPRTELECQLCSIWSAVLGVERVGTQDNFFELGGDSILSMQVAAKARQAGLTVSTKDLFARQTVAELVQVDGLLSGAPDADQGEVVGAVELTPIQRWFFESHPVHPEHYTMTFHVEPVGEVDVSALRSAVDALLTKHDALRMRFHHEDGRWRQHNNGLSDAEVLIVRELDSAQGVDALALSMQSSIELGSGPMLRVALTRTGARPRLLIVVHHLVVDGVSWRILLGDLESAYEQARSGVPVDLGPKTTSFREWASRLVESAEAGRFDDELSYWTEADPAAASRLPVDLPGPNSADSEQTLSVKLGRERTDALLQMVPSTYRTQINDIILSAAGVLFAEWSEQELVAIGMEGHGREHLGDDLDVSETVGWFTTHFPALLSVPKACGWGELIKSIKGQLRLIPGRGLGYDVLKYVLKHPELLAHRMPEVSVNYLGQFTTITASEKLYQRHLPNVGRDHHPDQERPYLLDVVGVVENGEMEFTWVYSANVHRPETIRRLADRLITLLDEIIGHCANVGVGGATPSDFPLCGLDQDQLDAALGNAEGVVDVYPLTPMQSGMLFHSLMESDAGTYFEQMSFVLGGVSEPELLAAAWQRVVDHTPILRTSLLWRGVPEPLQVVHRTCPLEIDHLDWSDLPAPKRRRRLAELLAKDRERGIDLSTAPLMRLTVVRLGRDQVRVVRSSHHVLLDGWSTSHVLADLFAAYQSLADGVEPTLPVRPPFREYVEWLSRQDGPAAESFWRQGLAGLSAPTALPFDRHPDASHGARSVVGHEIRIAAGTTRNLYETLKRHRLTVNSAVQGMWGLLLARYSGEQDVLFGATTSGRPDALPSVEDCVGLFINTMPVRVPVDEQATLAGLLTSLQDSQAASRQFDYVSLADLQSWSEFPPGASLFNSIVVFENFPFDADSAQRHGVEVVEFQAEESTNYPLSLVAHAGSELSLVLNFDPGLFENDTIRRMSNALRRLLEQVAANPDQPLSRVTLLTEHERSQLVDEVNRTDVSDADARPVHERFASQAVSSPDRTAVVAGDRSLTFAELDERSGRLAAYLTSRGVGADAMVGLAVERGIEMIVGLLGILKAGAAYVPLDPNYPPGRLRYMMDCCSPDLVLSQRSLADRLPLGRRPIVLLDSDWPEIDAHPPATEPVVVHPDQLAYVVFTSGSTGKPKGVQVVHRGVTNLCASHGATVFGPATDAVGRPLRVAHTASLSFDATMDQIIGMVHGAELHVIDEPTRRDAAALTAYVRRRGIDFLGVTPTLMHQLLELGALEGEGPTPSCVLLGGEGSGPELWARMRRHDGLTTHNFYAPSECTVDAVGANAADSATPRIGRPIRNTAVYVLDARLRPVPAGVPGEIYLAGDSLGRGYLGRADLTAERFVAAPFGPAGRRMYRSGDIGRWCADGMLEHLGRVDDQVKVRGHRIEPAEVEARILAYPGVRQAVVVARDDLLGMRLVGYVVTDPEGSVNTSRLRDFLAESLPDYLVPAAFVDLDELPLTPSGKLDRKLLPAPESRPTLETAFVEPRTGIERALSTIFAEVLGLDRVGAVDDFFELGGDSILSIKVVSRLRSRLGVELSPRVLFDNPVLADLGSLIAAEKPKAAAGPVSLPRGSASEQNFPLSFAQQRLWFLDEFSPESVEYNTGGGFALTGDLDIDALKQALNRLVERHEALRTTFDSLDGHGVQTVHHIVEPVIDLTDLSAVPADEHDAAVEAVLSQEMRTPFDLRRGPLLRTRLVRLATDRHRLVLCMHHIVTDGWSMGLIAEELGTLYSAAVAGVDARLPELHVQYADYAVWLREKLTGAVFDERLAYWVEKLGGLSPLELPTDRPRPPAKTSNGAVHRFDLPAAMAERLRGIGRQQDATLFMTLVAATKVLLARYTGQEDIALGTVTSGRDHVDLEHLVGFFVNTVVLRSTVHAQDSFEALLRTVRDTSAEAFAHADVPFERLVDALAPERDPSRNPLVQATVVLQNTPGGRFRLGDVGVEPLPLPIRSAVFDLSFEFGVEDSGLEALIEYNTDLFDENTVRQMAVQFQVLLESIVDDPAAKVGDLTVVSDSERATLLRQAASVNALPVPDRCVHELVDARARQVPEAAALRAGNVTLSFAELTTRANQLANHLRRRGAGPGSLVAISVERGIDMVVGLLGILKAGAAYVPLDPAYPPERLAFILEDSGATILITERELAGLPCSSEIETVRLDEERAPIAAQPTTAPETGVRPHDLAYVIYTSGSTGMPKGVLVEHRNVVNLLTHTIPHVGLGSEDVWSVFHSYAFDFSVWELWGALSSGGRAVLVPLPVARDPQQMWRLLRTEAITVLNQTPSSFRELVRTAVESGEALPVRLRTIIFGGEALEPRHVRDWFENYDGVRLVNMYGITETCVHVTYEELDWKEIQERGRISIGRPLGNYTAYLLDPRGNPLPAGARGELYIGGAGLARGYLNRPELTAQRFVEHPLADRLYRTGDLARRLPDGRLDYFGRADDQVKIRGFRIEPGEIEWALISHPAVSEATVVVQPMGKGSRLVAYLVSGSDGTPEVTELRAHLAHSLPDYMVPALFVQVAAIPLTPNGKVDRRALPEPVSQEQPVGERVPARNESEAKLAAAWAEVLGLTDIGVHDNFFELGGDSILSIQVVSKARNAGMYLTTKDIFTYQTIAELAEVAAADELVSSGIPAIGDSPLTPIQRWFFEHHPRHPDHFGMSVQLELADQADRTAMHLALSAVLAHHDVLRARFSSGDGQWRQRVLPVETAGVDLRVVDISRRTDQDQVLEAEALRAQEGLSLTNGPLLAAVLFVTATKPRLFLTAHHAVVDAVSWRILLEDLANAYQQAAAGKSVSLAPKTTSYREWAIRLQEHVSGGAFDRELEHWTAASAVPADVPVDGTGPNTVGSGETLAVRLDPAETEILLRRAPGRYRAQMNHLLLAATSRALSRWSGNAEVVIDVEGHGREDLFDEVDLSRTVGWFTSIFPVAFRVGDPERPDWRSITREVKKRLREVPGRGIGYGALRYLSGPDGAGHRLTASRGAQVSFNYLGQWEGTVDATTFGRHLPSVGSDQAPEEIRTHLIEVVAGVYAGELELTWMYSPNVHTIDTVRSLAEDVRHALWDIAQQNA